MAWSLVAFGAGCSLVGWTLASPGVQPVEALVAGALVSFGLAGARGRL